MTARHAHVLVTILDPLTGRRIDIQAGHISIPTDSPPRLSEVLDVLRGFVSQTEHATHHRTTTEPGDQHRSPPTVTRDPRGHHR